ncbi:MAG: 50S ribosomal protein L3 [Candidatus Omnitrophica bacterium]|nr:50S ribosomal protein L3 [Candidatus Omnitrophota bacterium]MCM8827210.1 50S ribosomal protein L3 [Candidatus Omnitrophota bacterium]
MIKEIFGKKLGMTQVFDENGNMFGVSVVEVEPVRILEKVIYPTKIRAKIGCFKVSPDRVNRLKKPLLGYFNKIGVEPYRMIKEVEIEDESNLEVNKEVGVEVFSEGDKVDVRAKNKGRGFQGGMRRHGWSGGPSSHGSMTHRRMGSAGANTDPGRVVKGHRMPGHMGNSYVTIRNLRVLKIDKEKNVLFIQGAIPGPVKTIVKIKKVKR